MLIYAFLFAPIVVLIIFSFNQLAAERSSGTGFTLDWYPRLFANADLLDALRITMVVAVIAVIGSTILGSLLGLGLARLRFRGSGSTETLILLPMVTPEIIMGISLLIFFSQAVRRIGSLPQIVARPHHVLHLVRGGGRPGPGDRDGPAAGGGRPRPGGVRARTRSAT